MTKKTLLSILHYFRSFLFIFGCLFLGNAIAAILPIPIPGSIIGLLLLFILLAFGIIPALWVQSGCHLFIRYIVILFIPASVAIMDYYTVLISQFAPIVISCLVSTLIVLITIGYLTESIYNKPTKTLADKKEEQL